MNPLFELILRSVNEEEDFVIETEGRFHPDTLGWLTDCVKSMTQCLIKVETLSNGNERVIVVFLK